MTCLATGKKRFETESLARRSASNIARHTGERRMRPYRCSSCRGWHLTSGAQ